MCAREVANGFARTRLRGLLGAEGEFPNVSGQGTDRRGLKGYSAGRRALGEQAVRAYQALPACWVVRWYSFD